MSHDTEAAWATQNIAQQIFNDNTICFSNHGDIDDAYAVAPPKVGWPQPDGLIRITRNGVDYVIALEYKRPNEGTHGILTALGQSISYVTTYAASIIVIPKQYSSNNDPGGFVTDILKHSAPDQPIAVFVYDEPEGTLECIQTIELDNITLPAIHSSIVTNAPKQQWAFVREGEFTPSMIFRMVQSAKKLDSARVPTIIDPLRNAVLQKFPTKIPEKVLSSAPNDTIFDQIWRQFWFDFVLTEDVQHIWKMDGGTYLVNEAPTKLFQFDGTPTKIFVGTSRSIKNKIVDKLNSGEISEDEAWKEFAENICGENGNDGRAHSARETYDSPVDALQLINEHGNPTTLGYRFVDECERQDNDANAPIPINILRHAILTNGMYYSFLKNIRDISEENFRTDPDSFVLGTSGFDQENYLKLIEDKFANDLHIINKVSARGGVARKPFQAELSILRKFGLINDFRRSVGLEIEWPLVFDIMNLNFSRDPEQSFVR